jgi:leader peptidase (prepilin peptidase)/N-methyltransferase
MPRGESLVSPPSHCPHCGMVIRWSQNIPILAWLRLRGRCAGCGAPISPRYIAVEALTGFCFAALWIAHGRTGPWSPFMCLFAAG